MVCDETALAERAVFGGDELMHFGLNMDKVDSDFAAYLLVFKKQ